MPVRNKVIVQSFVFAKMTFEISEINNSWNRCVSRINWTCARGNQVYYLWHKLFLCKLFLSGFRNLVLCSSFVFFYNFLINSTKPGCYISGMLFLRGFPSMFILYHGCDISVFLGRPCTSFVILFQCFVGVLGVFL